ncbi:hypothetical protein HID58_052427 [Brassica napus]|uniref:Uncharacterized protein n=1 Tax=Brassica napus TaxID=3708 RepID=A0ABQ8ABZ6_BRANA|nr:hypothetical protein HID58_052427 [Brassica napus]
MALKHIEAFVITFMDPQVFVAAAVSSTFTMLAQVTERARIQEAGHLRLEMSNGSAINGQPVSKSIWPEMFTLSGGRHAIHHASLMQNGGEARVLRSAAVAANIFFFFFFFFFAAAANMPREARIFAKIILRNLEHHLAESSI